MKKSFLVFLIIGLAIISIFSCRKSYEPSSEVTNLTKPVDEHEQRIIDFIKEMQGNLKSGSTYTIEQAIWYAEATLNFTYAIYDSDFIYLSRDTSRFSVELNQSNTVNQIDLVAAYNKMVDSLEAHYDGIGSETKHVMFCDIIDVNHSSGTLDLIMVSEIAYDHITTQYGSFGESDFWWAGGLAGKCGEFDGYEGRDATTELEYKLMDISPAQNVRVYYDPIVTVADIDPEDYPYTGAPRGNRGYSYRGEEPNNVMQCLDPDELNFYISSNGIPYIIDDNDTFLDKEFFFIDITWWSAYPLYEYYETHHYDISYGVRHETETNPTPLN